MQTATKRLICRLEKIEEGQAIIEARQYDCTPVYAYFPASELEMCFSDPRFRFIKVRVLKESTDAALIEWDAACACMDSCPGDTFWVSQKSLA